MVMICLALAFMLPQFSLHPGPDSWKCTAVKGLPDRNIQTLEIPYDPHQMGTAAQADPEKGVERSAAVFCIHTH